MKAHLLFALSFPFLLLGCKENPSSESDGVPDTSDTSSDIRIETGIDICKNLEVFEESSYTVAVNGHTVDVIHISRFDVPISFVRFDAMDDNEVEIISEQGIDSFTLSPKNRDIDAVHEGNRITFSVSEPGYLILQPASGDRAMENLFILIDPKEETPPAPEDAAVVSILEFEGVDRCGASLMTDIIQVAIDSVEGTEKILYFPPGLYLTGELWMRSDMTLYLSDGAVLRASSSLSDIVTGDTRGSVIEQCRHGLIRMFEVKNSHIRGRGIIDAGGTHLRVKENPMTKYNLLKIEESADCTVEGVVALDSSFWNTIVYRSDDIHIANYKVINHRLNNTWNETDGVDFDNTTNSTLKNAFLYTGDDCMSTKSDDIPDDYHIPEGAGTYPEDPTEAGDNYISVNNIVHENVVCYTNQSACKIGTKTMGKTLSNVVFKNIDVPKCGRGMVIDAMDTATVEDITFENIDLEYIVPFDAVDFGINSGTGYRISEGVGAIENIVARNISIEKFEYAKPLFKIKGREAGDTDDIYPIGDVTFTNVYYDGAHVTDDTLSLIRQSLLYADSVTFQ